MPIQDLLVGAEPSPFYTQRELEYDHWDEPEIIIDPLTGFANAIPPRGSGSCSPSPWREMLTRWLRRLGVTTALILIAASSAHAEQSLLNLISPAFTL
jgi:hypothetical protein